MVNCLVKLFREHQLDLQAHLVSWCRVRTLDIVIERRLQVNRVIGEVEVNEWLNVQHMLWLVQWADVEVAVPLERHADQAGDWVLCSFRECLGIGVLSRRQAKRQSADNLNYHLGNVRFRFHQMLSAPIPRRR